jgi:hypothetical protein
LKCNNCEYIQSQKKIECDVCPYGSNECGWARCLTVEEFEFLKIFFKNSGENEK